MVYLIFLNTQLSMSTSQVNETIDQLESKPYTKRVLCSDGGNIILIPILLSMNNKSYNGNNLNVKPMTSCKSAIRSKQENPDIEYIELPYF